MTYGSSEIGRPGRLGMWTRTRVNPGVIVWIITGLAVFLPLREASGAFVWWKYAATYRAMDFVLTQLPTMDGQLARGILVPRGTPVDIPADPAALPPIGEEWVWPVATRDGHTMFADAPPIVAAPGSRLPVWWSREAPAFGYGSHRASNIAAVDRRPSRPGLWLIVWTGLIGLAAVLGVTATLLASRWNTEWRTEVLLDEAPTSGPPHG